MNEEERLKYEAGVLLDFYITKVLEDDWGNYHNLRMVGRMLGRCIKLVELYSLDNAMTMVNKYKSISFFEMTEKYGK